MTYVTRGERVFKLPDPRYINCSPPDIKRSDHRLKRYPSVNDRRAWACDETERYRHLYELMTGSRTCISPKSSCFKYIPLEDLIDILLADKLAYIRELEKRLREMESAMTIPTTDTESEPAGIMSTAIPTNLEEQPFPAPVSIIDDTEAFTYSESAARKMSSVAGVEKIGSPAGSVKIMSPVGSGPKISEIYTAKAFDESDEDREEKEEQNAAIINCLRTKIANLNAELANLRCTLRKAMHKLENIDEIISENNCLRDKLRCSEEAIKRLEEKKRDLEKELEKLRSNSQIQKDLKRATEELAAIKGKEKDANGNEALLQSLAAERDALQLEVEELQRELAEAKRCRDEFELLRKQSETATVNLEEVSKENDCYKKKLETMKCLEKQICELKKQATALTDKYKRESLKANDQISQLTNSAREVKMLQEERDRLNKRIEELANYETEYNCLKEKLEQVESILAENECLNMKLLELDQLEIENQQLQCKINELKCKEFESAEDKEQISQLQTAIADQEEEMKKLLDQLDRLTKDKTAETEEIMRLREEINERDEKLRLCEQQLAEIPLLEAEIEDLQMKMKKCCEGLSPDKEELKRLHDELESYRRRFKSLDKEETWYIPESSKKPVEERKEAMRIAWVPQSVVERKEEPKESVRTVWEVAQSSRKQSEERKESLRTAHEIPQSIKSEERKELARTAADVPQSSRRQSEERRESLRAAEVPQSPKIEERKEIARAAVETPQSSRRQSEGRRESLRAAEVPQSPKTEERKELARAVVDVPQSSRRQSEERKESLRSAAEIPQSTRRKSEERKESVRMAAEVPRSSRRPSEERKESVRTSLIKGKEGKRERETSTVQPTLDNKETMTCEEIHQLIQSSTNIISGVLEDMIEHRRETQELEETNRAMKDQIETLITSVAKFGIDDPFQEIIDLRHDLQLKDKKINELEKLADACKNIDEIKRRICQYEKDLAQMNELNKQLQMELDEAGLSLAKVAELERTIKAERKARIFSEELARDLEEQLKGETSFQKVKEDLSKLQKEEQNLATRESVSSYIKEIEDLRNQIAKLNLLVEELKRENDLLRELQAPGPDFEKELKEKEELQELLKKCQDELDSVHAQNLNDECNALREELKRLMNEHDSCKNKLALYKDTLDCERKTRSLLEEQLNKSQASTSKENPCERTISVIRSQREKLTLEECIRQRDCWKCDAQMLRSRNKCLQEQIIKLCAKIDKMNKDSVGVEREFDAELEKLRRCSKESQQKIQALEREKEKLKTDAIKAAEESRKLSSEMEVLENRLKEAEGGAVDHLDEYRKSIEDKHAVENTMRDLEDELNALKKRLEDCLKKEEKKTVEELPKEKKKEEEKPKDDKKIRDLEKENEELRKKLEESKKAGPVHASSSQAVQAVDDSLQKELDAFRKQLEACKKREEELVKKKDVPPQKIEEVKVVEKIVKEEDTLALDELKKQLEECARERDNLKNNVKEMESELKKKEVPVVSASKEEKKPEECKNCKKLEEELAKLRKEMESLRKTPQVISPQVVVPQGVAPQVAYPQPVSQPEEKVEIYLPTKEIDNMENELNTLRKQLQECKKMEQEINQLKKDKENLINSVGQLEKQLEKEKEKVVEMSKPKETPKKEVDKAPEPTLKPIAEAKAPKKVESKAPAVKPVEAKAPKKIESKAPVVKPVEPSKPVDLPKKVESKAPVIKPTEPTPKPVVEAKAPKKPEDKSKTSVKKEESKITPPKKDAEPPKKIKEPVVESKAPRPASADESLSRPESSVADKRPASAPKKPEKPQTPAKRPSSPTKRPEEPRAPKKEVKVVPAKKEVEAPLAIKTLQPAKDNCDELQREVRNLRGQVANLQNELNRVRVENQRLSQVREPPQQPRPQSAPCLSPQSSLVNFSDLDPDFERFKRNMCPEDHKRNIIEIEKRYKIQMELLEESFSKKIKKLLNQNEKESERKDKTFNNNLNLMRSSYEGRIKKLAEKHKDSILKLQSLHEDEMREINTNYETQMESMQTQNENVVNDITQGATLKFKKLAEQHNRDIQDLERRFHQILEEKETEHLFEMSNLQTSLSHNMDEVEESHKRTMKSMNKALEDNIAEMEAKHCCELKKLKRSHKKRVDMVKGKYEDLLMDQRKKYEEQLEAIIRKGERGCSCECKFMGFRPKKIQDPNSPLDFYEVVHKIINEGFESLTFNELVLLHRKTCYATESKLLDPQLRAELEPSIGTSCPQSALLHADKEHLLQRICILENEIKAKQMETQEAIVNMEMALRAEQCRLESVKKALYEEQEVNSQLKTLLSSQSRHRSDLEIERDLLSRQASLHENQVIEKVKELEKERAYARSLEEENQKLRINVQILTNLRPDSRLGSHRRKEPDYIPTRQMR